MIERGSTPRLAPGVRLREDVFGGRTVLLAPERGLLLGATAAAVLRLCDGRDVDDLVRALGQGDVLGDVLPFLQALADRGLIE